MTKRTTLGVVFVALLLSTQIAQARALSSLLPTGTGINLIGHPAPSDWSPYTVALMQSWDFAKQQQATSAGVFPVEYKDLTSTRETDCAPDNVSGGSPCIVGGVICPAGVNDAQEFAGGLGFCSTYRNHPGWFYHHNGQLVAESGFPTQYLMDWANTSYQAAWASAVAADAQANGWTWVWADNALVNPRSYTTFDTYGGASATQSATQAMLTTIKNIWTASLAHPPQLVANLGWTNLYPTLWDSWLPLVSGFGDEHSAGNVTDEKANCTSQAKSCFFGSSSGGIDPTFQVVSS